MLAMRHMDRHAAYVGLTRHRDGVAQHYATEDFADPGWLACSLSRERAKDTTLDYDRDHDLVRRYAERRGLDRLHPQSEIVLAPAPVQQPEAERLAPRRGKFAGLRLTSSRPAELAEVPPARAEDMPATALTEAERQWVQLKECGPPCRPSRGWCRGSGPPRGGRG